MPYIKESNGLGSLEEDQKGSLEWDYWQDFLAAKDKLYLSDLFAEYSDEYPISIEIEFGTDVLSITTQTQFQVDRQVILVSLNTLRLAS